MTHLSWHTVGDNVKFAKFVNPYLLALFALSVSQMTARVPRMRATAGANFPILN